MIIRPTVYRMLDHVPFHGIQSVLVLNSEGRFTDSVILLLNNTSPNVTQRHVMGDGQNTVHRLDLFSCGSHIFGPSNEALKFTSNVDMPDNML